MACETAGLCNLGEFLHKARLTNAGFAANHDCLSSTRLQALFGDCSKLSQLWPTPDKGSQSLTLDGSVDSFDPPRTHRDLEALHLDLTQVGTIGEARERPQYCI